MPPYRSKGPQLFQEFRSLWNILIAAATDHHSNGITCVFDALDECEESTRTLLAKTLVDFQSQCMQDLRQLPAGEQSKTAEAQSYLKIFVTCRPHRYIED